MTHIESFAFRLGPPLAALCLVSTAAQLQSCEQTGDEDTSATATPEPSLPPDSPTPTPTPTPVPALTGCNRPDAFIQTDPLCGPPERPCQLVADQVLDECFFRNDSPSIALDGQCQPHMLFARAEGDYDGFYARRDPRGICTTEPTNMKVVSGGLLIDGQGVADAVVYSGSHDVGYWRLESADWRLEKRFPGESYFSVGGLAWYDDDLVYAGYVEYDLVHYATRSGEWTFTGWNDDVYTTIAAVSPAGQLQLAYWSMAGQSWVPMWASPPGTLESAGPATWPGDASLFLAVTPGTDTQREAAAQREENGHEAYAADPSQLAVPGGPTGPEGFLQPQPLAIHFVLTLPVTRIGVGVFSVAILEQLLGFKLEEILRPMMTGPAYQRPSMAGPAVNCYPMALPVGEGLSLNLNSWGELGMHNQAGLLCLSVPLFAASWMTPRLAHVLVRGPEQGISATRTARVALYWIRLMPGMRASVPVSVQGEIGVEAG